MSYASAKYTYQEFIAVINQVSDKTMRNSSIMNAAIVWARFIAAINSVSKNGEKLLLEWQTLDLPAINPAQAEIIIRPSMSQASLVESMAAAGNNQEVIAHLLAQIFEEQVFCFVRQMMNWLVERYGKEKDTFNKISSALGKVYSQSANLLIQTNLPVKSTLLRLEGMLEHDFEGADEFLKEIRIQD